MEAIFGSDRGLPDSLIVGRKADDRCILILIKGRLYDLEYYRARSKKTLENETCNCSRAEVIVLVVDFLKRTND